MLRRTMLSLIMTGILMAGSNAVAENVLVLKIGPTWPKQLLDSKKPTAWDASVQTGLIVDRKIAFGGGIDFLWNVYKKETNVTGDFYRLEEVKRTFMFPVSGYIALTPIPDYRFHPCASVQIGLNTMYYSSDSTQISASETTKLGDVNGWYMGFYCKIAADAIFNLGEQSGLFAGLDYQWANTKKLNPKRNELYPKLNMSGLGISMGIRLLY